MIEPTFDRYRIVRTLGAGGMGEVYLAEDMTLKRQVALKLLPPAFTQDEDRVRRFRQEADAASGLNHPNILTIYEAGESQGHHFITTEFIDGETLGQVLRRTGRMSVSEALAVATQVASALAAAHGAGIVHRDIKPDNVMVRRDGYVKVLDFGLAKLTQASAIAASDSNMATGSLVHTEAGAVFGTVPYMSPEQARGITVDARTDVWSFGCVLYELLAGVSPFARETTTDMLVAILDKEPAPLRQLAPDVPAELEWMVARSLRKVPAERYQTSQELLVDLRRLEKQLDVQAHLERVEPKNPVGAATSVAIPSTAVPASGSGRTRVSRRVLLTAAGIALAAALVSVWYWRQSAAPSTTVIRSLAVLPLKSLDAGDQYLGLGIADAVIRATSQTAEMIVRPTSAVRRYLDEDTDAITAARQLNADAVLEGSVQRAGDRLRVSVNLLRADTGASLWADSFDMRMTDIFTIQDTVAQQVASHVRLRLDASQQARLSSRSTANPIAYEFYLKGLYTFDQRMSGTAAQDTAIDLLVKAIEADPNFALAHAQLAQAYAAKAVFRSTTETVWAERAGAEIQRAQALDPLLAETEVARYRLLFSRYEGFQGEAAVRALRSAQQLNPNIGHAELGHVFIHLGLPDLAARALQRALEIDPTSAYAKGQMLAMYEMSGQYDEWFAAHQRLEPNQPIEPSYFIATGRLDDAQRAIDGPAQRNEGGVFALLPSKALLAAAKGDFRTAEAAIPALLDRHPVKDPYYHHTAYYIASIYARGGKRVEAVKWLREAVATGFSCYPLFERDPSLDRIRKTSEFMQFMAELKATTDRYRREFAPAS